MLLLSNIVNNKCRPFQANINCCSKFIIDTLQQRCHATFLIYCLEHLECFCLVYLYVKEIHYNLTKNSHKFQANFTERCSSGVVLEVLVLECFAKIFEKCLWKSWILKKFYCTCFFFTYSLIYLFTEACLFLI